MIKKQYSIISGNCLHILVFLLSIISGNNCYARFEIELESNQFYTDDVSLFTVTRQLSLLDDPTQPTVDRPNGQPDFVYEPTAAISWYMPNELGETSFYVKAGGYVFAEHSDYTHASLQVDLLHRFNTDTTISVIYRFIPDRFLGNNFIQQEFEKERDKTETGEEDSNHDSAQRTENIIKGEETLTSHIWSLHVEQKLTEQLSLHLLGRYGMRKYDGVFQHRDTNLWTVGTHLEIELSEGTEIFLGYHYEEGNASNQRALFINDDVSYYTNYAAIEFKTVLSKKLKLALDFDYEKNTYTTSNSVDEHYHNPEEIFQGGLELQYSLTEAALLKLGFQHGSRKRKNEKESIHNNNAWFSMAYTF